MPAELKTILLGSFSTASGEGLAAPDGVQFTTTDLVSTIRRWDHAPYPTLPSEQSFLKASYALAVVPREENASKEKDSSSCDSIEVGAVIGYAAVLPIKLTVRGAAAQEWYLQSVMVLPAHRKKGAATAMLKAILAKVATCDNVLRIRLHTMVPPVGNLLQQSSLSNARRVAFVDSDGEDCEEDEKPANVTANGPASVWDDVAATVLWYKGHGFEVTKNLPGYYDRRFDGVEMVRSVAADGFLKRKRKE